MKTRGKALLAGAMAAAAFAMPTSGAQAAQVGDVCNVAVSYWVSSQPATDTRYIMYILGTGAGFRIEAFAANDYYYGHGNGQASGYFPRGNINQGTCHP